MPAKTIDDWCSMISPGSSNSFPLAVCPKTRFSPWQSTSMCFAHRSMSCSTKRDLLSCSRLPCESNPCDYRLSMTYCRTTEHFKHSLDKKTLPFLNPLSKGSGFTPTPFQSCSPMIVAMSFERSNRPWPSSVPSPMPSCRERLIRPPTTSCTERERQRLRDDVIRLTKPVARASPPTGVLHQNLPLYQFSNIAKSSVG